MADRASISTITHPSSRQSSLSVTRGAKTTRTLGYTNTKDIMVEAAVVVLEGYMKVLRERPFPQVGYASEIILRTKPIVYSLIDVHRLPVPKATDNALIDLARTIQEIVRGSTSVDRFSILNPQQFIRKHHA
jgi:hypothetical protein